MATSEFALPSVAEKVEDGNYSGDTTTEPDAPYAEDTDVENQTPPTSTASKELISEEEWAKEPSNPMNWPTWRKVMLISCISSMGFMA